MAVPKKKTSHQKQHQRRAHWKAGQTTLTKCPNCGATTKPHNACSECFYYNGRPVFKSDQVL